MYLIKEQPFIKQLCSFCSMFDLYRLVDPITHKIYKIENGTPISDNNEKCYEIWHRTKPCENCTSLRACNNKRQYIKIEYLDERILLISSMPVNFGDKVYSLELALDVTSSMYVSDNFHSDTTEITQLVKKFNEISVHDSFTQLYNNTYIYSTLDYIIQSHTTNMLSFAVFDIDNFKRINDSFGHLFGDEVIKTVARIIQNCVKAHEGIVAGRIGGDEFGLIISHSKPEIAKGICDEIADKVAAYDFQSEDKLVTVTLSFGCAEYLPGDTKNTLAERADRKMYECKLRIRNKTNLTE